VKVTTTGEKNVTVEGTYFFHSRALSFALYAESNKSLLSLTDLAHQAEVAQVREVSSVPEQALFPHKSRRLPNFYATSPFSRTEHA
jgi:hypothetical protein